MQWRSVSIVFSCEGASQGVLVMRDLACMCSLTANIQHAINPLAQQQPQKEERATQIILVSSTRGCCVCLMKNR